MPTVSQLPSATSTNDDDLLMLVQGGLSVAASTGLLLAGTQSALTLAQGALLGRVSASPGGPEAVVLGSGFSLSQGVLAADTAVLATVANPSFTGTPTAPTQAAGSANAAIATTAFVAASQPALVFTGDVLGSGSSPIALALPPIATPGVFTKLTVNAKGQVTAGAAIAAADVTAALGYTPGSMAQQSASGVAITGGSIAGADLSAGSLRALHGTTARTAAARAADRLLLLDYGADPTGIADSGPAFSAALNTLPSGSAARLFVPRGVYRLSGIIYPPAGVSVTVEFEDGASFSGPGFLAVARVESRQGPFRIAQTGGGFFPYAAGVGVAGNLPFNYELVENNPQNSAAARVAWARDYTNVNLYSKYAGGIDFAEQNIYAWPNLLDNSSGWGHWEVITGATYDEDTASRAQLSASAEHSEFDVVNNGPDHGWTFQSGIGTAVQGMSMDPWGQNGLYGGHILYAYGSVGGYSEGAGINRRWIAYPAAYSAGNPAAVARASTLTISMDLTASATAYIGAGGVVTGVTVNGGGGLYASLPGVVFSGGGGSGATGTAKLVGGAVVGVTLGNAGSGYSAAPAVTFVGGGVPAPAMVTLTLNADGSHGDLASIAAAVRSANIPYVNASVAVWGGAVSSLVLFGTAPGDLGTLTLGGSALATLGIPAQPYTTLRNDTAVVFGGSGSVAAGAQLTVNGVVVTVAGAGAPSDVAAAINAAGLSGVKADVASAGQLVLTAHLPDQPCGLVLSQPAGATTLQALSLPAATILPPTPPKAFATAMGEIGAPACRPGDAISLSATDLAGNSHGPVVAVVGSDGSVVGVVAAVRAALAAAGWLSSGFAALTAAPALVACYAHNGVGIVIRNTGGGTLTLANAAGTPLDTLGLVAGTCQPGGYSAGSQTVYMAAPNSIAPQGRGVFVGGSTVPDRSVWPHAPAEFRGSFAHGLRMDRASFADGCGVLLGSAQSIAWGIGGPMLSATAAVVTLSAPAVMPGLTLTALPTSNVGLGAGTIWNNAGVLSIA